MSVILFVKIISRAMRAPAFHQAAGQFIRFSSNALTDNFLPHFPKSLQVIVFQCLIKAGKRSDVVWIISDIIFPMSYVVFPTSDVVLAVLVLRQL